MLEDFLTNPVWHHAHSYVDGGLVFVLFSLVILLGLKMRTARKARLALEQVEQELDDVAAQEAIFRAIAENANDGLVYQDMGAQIIWANTAYCRTMGRELDEIIGRKPQEFCFAPEVKPSEEEIANFRFNPEDDTFREFHRHPNIRKDGERFWHEFSQAMVTSRKGEKRVVLVSRDVTQQVERELELEKAKETLSHAAGHDALTGLLNRSAFLERADDILSNNEQSDRQLGLIYIDLDHFKAINDSHGHAAGDRILLHIADAMCETVGEDGLCCRMGGDEFVAAVPGVEDFNTLQFIADALLERIRTPIKDFETTLKCSASIGMALSDGVEMTAEDLIRSADFALYEAKTPGAAHIARYDAQLHERQERENAMMEEFVEALDAGDFHFHFQPILDARTQKIRSFETLARWTRANGENVAPDRFLPFAARLNRMTDIDFAAVRAAASLVAELRDRGHKIRGAFNTSSEALAHGNFLARLEAEASEAGLTSDLLIAEVLETTFFGADTTNSVAAARINELRESGYAVYLDDFGIGYAGLAHLGQLNVSGVKLDRSLIANVTQDRSARIITTSILRLCHTLGVGTLAEGIETREQADFLFKHGCFRLQGFGIARPMPREELISLVERDKQILIPPGHPTSDDLPKAV